MHSKPPTLSKLYWLFVVTLTVVLLAVSGQGLAAEKVGALIFFAILTLAMEALPVKLPRGGTISVGFAVNYACSLLFGPLPAALIAAIGTISLTELRRLRSDLPLLTFLFNRAQLALAAAAAAGTYTILGGHSTLFNPLVDFLPLFAGGAVYYLVNAGAMTISIAILQRGSPWNVWVTNFKLITPHYLALTPISYLIAAVYASVGFLGVALFFLPLFAARFAFQRYTDMRRIFLSTISALTRALEAKDEYTSGHGERVAQISVGIGREMGMGEDQVELLRYVGILHDIGKIGVRDALLNKPGKYTDGEYQIMKGHSEIGANIIAGIEALGQGAAWLRFHHERWDGSGYPMGLRGEEIPLGARIISVADSLDAMVSRRPYRKTRSLEEALAEIEQCASSQFDPLVVEALLKLVSDPEFTKAIEFRTTTFPLGTGSVWESHDSATSQGGRLS